MRNYKSGFVPYDGNGMVGGHWWAADAIGYCERWADDIAEKVADLLCLYLPEKFRIEASFEVGSDPTVGMPNYCDLDVIQEPDELYEAIENANISGSWKTALRAVVDAYIEDLEDADFVIDD